MRLLSRRALGAALFLIRPCLVSADEPPLTHESALARARLQAPAIVSARARVDEARARLRGAEVLRDNPVFEGAYGHRDDGIPANLEAGLSQTFELGGKRGARVAAAQAAVAREAAAGAEAERRVVREVAATFFGAVEARERMRLAGLAESQAAEISRIAQTRYERGDIPVLEVNVARSALARARADGHAAAASEAAALGDLRVRLDLPVDQPVTVAAELTEGTPPELPPLVRAALERPDLKALAAELADAEAEIRLGKSASWPDVSPSVRYERDDGAPVLWGGVSLTLPLFNRGQEQRAAGTARADRVRREIEALRRAVQNEVSSAWETYGLRLKAAASLQATVAALDDNDALARRSYEVGQIGLGELLLVRRETLEARAALLQRQIEAAQARVELETRAGVLR